MNSKMNDDGRDNRIAQNSIALTIRMIIVLCINLYTTRVLLNALGVEDYGIYNVVCGFVSMLSFLSTAISNGIQRFYNVELAKENIEGGINVFNASLAIQTLLAIIIIIILETIGVWYLSNNIVIPIERISAAQIVFQCSVLSFVLAIMQTPFSAAIIAHERMNFYALVSVLNAILNLIIVIITNSSKHDRLILYAILTTTINIITLLANVFYSRNKFVEIKFKKSIDKNIFKQMIGFSSWNIFGTFSSISLDQGMNLMLNLSFGPVVNAARGIAMQIRGGLQSFVSNLTIPIRPQVIQSYICEDTKRTMGLTYSISKLSCFCLYMIALPILLEIHFVLTYWLKGNVPEHTASFVFIIIGITLINNLNSAISGIVHASGKMKRYQLTTSAVSLSSIPACYILLKFGGSAEIALITNLFFIFLSQCVALIILKSIINYEISTYLKNVILPFFKILAVSIWIPLILRITMPWGWFRFLAVCITSETIVLISISAIGLNTQEKYIVKSLFNKLIKEHGQK